MNLFGRLISRIKNLSPASIREIIAVIVILCLSVTLSLPQYYRDRETAKTLRNPVTKDNSFPVAKPETQGMDEAKLEAGVKSLKFTSALSLIVIRNGKIVCEHYYNSQGSRRNNVYSVTKSIISALTGIAVREGYIHSVDEKAATYLPECFKYVQDPRWRQISIKHLLTMTPGFCENLDEWVSNKDWVEATLKLPLKMAPGAKFQYANSASHLLAVILEKATGMKLKVFADKYLFGPLDISSPEWSTDPDGHNTGYANLYLSPRDMAKFGWMYYSEGKWKGRQIVPEEWVAASTSVQYDFNSEKGIDTDIDAEKNNTAAEKNNTAGGLKSLTENGYGDYWWINGRTGQHMFSALGYGGQTIDVIPDLGLEVVITCNPGSESLTNEEREQFIRKYIIASIK